MLTYLVRLVFALVCTQLAWAQRWPSALEVSLQTQAIQRAQSLEQVIRSEGQEWQGSSQLWLLDLKDGTRGVFRSEDEPWGSQAEVAGYHLSQWLQLDLVPPTVPRTIQKSEWPESWPFPQESRTGSVQLYLKTGPARPIDPDTQADIEVLSYVMGRYDNHSGNLVFDQNGRPCMVDFENTLELQKTRYGQISYVRRGQARPDLPGRSGEFPYDHPDTLIDPSLAQIQAKFSPWWVYWTQGMQSLHQQTRHLQDRTINYVIWNHHLWVQARAASRHPAHTDHYHDQTMARLAQLDAQHLGALLPPPYTQEHIDTMLERTAAVLGASSRAGLSPPSTPPPSPSCGWSSSK